MARSRPSSPPETLPSKSFVSSATFSCGKPGRTSNVPLASAFPSAADRLRLHFPASRDKDALLSRNVAFAATGSPGRPSVLIVPRLLLRAESVNRAESLNRPTAGLSSIS